MVINRNIAGGCKRGGMSNGLSLATLKMQTVAWTSSTKCGFEDQ